MATQVQFRRGTTTQNNAFTGAIGEITYDTEVKTLRLHDGSNPGGGAILVNLNATQNLTNKTLSTNSVWNGNPVSLTYGGTGAALTGVAGGIVYSGGSALGISAAGTSGQVLTSGGGSAPTWVTASSLTVGTSTTATTAANISGGSPGYIMYQVDTNQTGFITPGTAGFVLRSTGSSTAPEWVTSALTIGSTPVQVGDTVTSFAGINILAATGTSHWTLPVGTTAQRPGTPATGMIRYNSSISSFEGYSSSAWSSLGGVKSVDGYTYIRAETSPGTGNGDLDFFAENSGGTAGQQVGQWNRTNLKDYTGTIVGTQTTQNVFDTTATTINFGGAATAIDIGAGTGTTAIKNNATVAGTLGVTGATTLSSTLDVTGVVNLNNTTDSSSATTGALIVDGGVGIAKNLHVGVNAEIDGNLVVDGNLTINGTTTTISATNLAIEDNLIYLNEGSTISNPDLGITGNYNDGTYAHAGIFRDATDGGTWKIFKGYVPEPGTAIDTTHASFDLADLDVGGFYASDNASIGGTLGVTGATTLSSTLGVTGATTLSSTLAVSGTSTLTGNVTTSGDLAVNGGDITTTAATASVFNSNATTVNAFGAATTLNIGSSTGTVTLNNANTIITGNLTVNGTTTTVNSSTVNLDNLILQLGGDTIPTVNDGLDRGVAFRWYNTAARNGFFGFDNNSGYFTFIPDATISAGVVSGTKGTLDVTSITGSAAKWTTARTITLGGDLTGSVSIDGSANVTLTATVAANSVALGTDTTGNYMVNVAAGTGISVSHTQGEGSTATITNTGVTSITAGTGVTVSGSTGGVTVSIGQAVATSSDVQFDSIGVGTAAAGTTGTIRATNQITAYYSDARLKEDIKPIENAIEKVKAISGVTYKPNAIAESFGYTNKEEHVGVLAQEVEAVLPQVVKPAPFDILQLQEGVEISRSGQNYKTVQYEKLVPLLIQAIKEQQIMIEELQKKAGI